MKRSVIRFTRPDLVALSIQGLRSRFGRLELSVTRLGRQPQAHGHLAVRAARQDPDVITNQLGKGSHRFPVIPVQVGTVPAVRHRFGKSDCTASGPAQTAARARGCRSRVRARRSWGPWPRTHSVHQPSTASTSGMMPSNKGTRRSLTRIVASPTRQAKRGETSLAGSFLHAHFEIRQSCTIGVGSAAHEGATDEQDARSAAKWRAGKLEAARRVVRRPGLSGCRQRRDQRVPENCAWGGAARSSRVLDARARGLAGPRYATGPCGERSLASRCVGPGEPKRQNQTAGRERPSLLPQLKGCTKSLDQAGSRRRSMK